MRALLLTGQFGAGKSAVAAEASHQLGARGIRHAAIDLDWLAWAGPDLEGDGLQQLLAANLTAVAANLAAVGIERLVLARSLQSLAEREVVQRALPAYELVVVRLVVDRAVALDRVRGRDSDSELAELLAAAAAVAAAVDQAGAHDLDVANSGDRSVASVTAEVLRRCGWLDRP